MRMRTYAGLRLRRHHASRCQFRGICFMSTRTVLCTHSLSFLLFFFGPVFPPKYDLFHPKARQALRLSFTSPRSRLPSLFPPPRSSPLLPTTPPCPSPVTFRHASCVRVFAGRSAPLLRSLLLSLFCSRFGLQPLAKVLVVCY